jgi:hypothetical protein
MTSVYDLFASPNLCMQLTACGVSQNTLAFYRRYHNGETVIISEAFDPLGLYKEMPITHYRQSYEQFAAYSLGEIARCIPGFSILHDGQIWTACGERIFAIPCVDDMRMSDAAAKCLLRSLQSRVISLTTINHLFDNPTQIKNK